MISEGSFNNEGWSNNAENYLQYFSYFKILLVYFTVFLIK